MKKLILALLAAAACLVSCNKEDSSSLDGRWDGVMDESEVGQGQQRITLIFKGNVVDLYIVPWGDHLKGTYTYENNVLNFNITDAWDALIKDEYSSGWSHSDGALDPETFELKFTEELPYLWYSMDQETLSMDIDFLKDFTFTITEKGKATSDRPMPLIYIKR